MRLLPIVIGASFALAIKPARKPHSPRGNGEKLLTFNETVLNGGGLDYDYTTVEWAENGEDGQYVYVNGDDDLVLADIVSGSEDVLVAADDFPDDYYAYWLNVNQTKVLWATNYTQNYRHSFWADYVIQDLDSGDVQPLVADQAGDIQYAQWNPVSDMIAYVRDNDLFIWEDGESTQITSDGGPNTFSGIPDWVYEEEIFGTNYVLWFSPDGQVLSYLRIDETGVPTYTVPYYMNNNKYPPPYPYELDIRYPKVGQTNPTVTFHLLDLSSLETSKVPLDSFPAEELIVGEVAWLTDGHSNIMVRTFNRVQDQEKLILVDVAQSSGSVVRERDGSDGWLEPSASISYVGKVKSSKTNANQKYYLDASDESGWRHLYLYPVNGDKAVALTKGEWEVDQILKVDRKRKLVYYTSTEADSTERHVYSVSFKTLEKTALVDDTVPAYYEAGFSSGGFYYILDYYGPDVPYQELYSINSTEPIRTITSNKKLYQKLKEYKLPRIEWSELSHPDGYTLNVMTQYPANFDSSKKYPVLFTPYGGPNSQSTAKTYLLPSWEYYIGSDPELEYITYTVDNRGTGLKGRAFRSLVTSQLGKLEAEDQVWAAKELAKKPYVDANHIGIWGWSYGGYLTGKVLETDSDAFSLGLITAPVSDWRLYDSMYTERYMKTLTGNTAGYAESAIRNTAGFKNVAGGFLVQHGTGDDNVHFQNSAALVDLLVGAEVTPEKMQVQWFTDSDHSINYNHATPFLYRQLTKKIYEEKMRKGTGKQHQWSRRGMGELEAAPIE